MECGRGTARSFSTLSLIIIGDLVYRLTKISLDINTRELGIVNIEVIKLNPIIFFCRTLPFILLRLFFLLFTLTQSNGCLAKEIRKYLVNLGCLLDDAGAGITGKAKIL